MNVYFFTYRSVTAAQRAQRALAAAGIPAELTRTPGPLAKNGCGYCLRVSARWAGAAAQALRDTEAQGLWLRRGDRYEEADDDLL